MGWFFGYRFAHVVITKMINPVSFFLIIILQFIAFGAFASSVQPTWYGDVSYCATGSPSATVPVSVQGTFSAACGQFVSVLSSHVPQQPIPGCSGIESLSGGVQNGVCAVTFISKTEFGASIPGSGQFDIYRSCPAGFTFNQVTNLCDGEQTECPAGEFRDISGVCQKDCTGKQGQKTASYGYGINGGGHNTTVSGCQVHCAESVCYGPECSIGDCKYTGKPGSQPGDGTYVGPEQKPDPTKNPPAKPSDCGVKGQGYIQSSTGVITCVPSSDSPNSSPTVSSEKSAESGKTGSDGKPDPTSSDYKKSESTSTSSGSGTSTTTKTTENPDTSKNGTTNGGCPAGAAVVDGKCVTTTTTTEATSDFCTKNPNATACKAAKDACVDNPSLISCAKAGEPETVPDPEKTEKSLSSVSIVPIGSGGAYCPVDVTVRGATFTYSKLCEGLNTVKPVVIALAWIAAAFIMFGSVKGS